MRARNLHEQAMTQTSRIQRIGHETQRISAARSAAAAMPGQEGFLVDIDMGTFEDQSSAFFTVWCLVLKFLTSPKRVRLWMY